MTIVGRTSTPKRLRRPRRNPFADRYTEAIYEPYALAIGQVALAWNDLCNMLAGIFWTVLGGGFPDVPLAAWNALRADRTQRDMLRPAVAAFFNGGTGAATLQKYPTAKADFDWLLVEVGKLEDARNNAIHAPLAAIRGEENARVVPNTLMGHPRARRLDQLPNSDAVLAEFRRCRDTANCLRDYGWRMDLVLCRGKGTWPERPVLPIAHQPRKGRPRRNNPIGLPPPPSSSPE